MRCPTCKEPVSQFAAGCAYCGADLDEARRRVAERRARRPTVPRAAVPAAVPRDLGVLVLTVLGVLLFPLFGTLIAVLYARSLSLSSQRRLRLALWAGVAIGLGLLFVPATRYGVLGLLYGG